MKIICKKCNRFDANLFKLICTKNEIKQKPFSDWFFLRFHFTKKKSKCSSNYIAVQLLNIQSAATQGSAKASKITTTTRTPQNQTNADRNSIWQCFTFN